MSVETQEELQIMFAWMFHILPGEEAGRIVANIMHALFGQGRLGVFKAVSDGI